MRIVVDEEIRADTDELGGLIVASFEGVDPEGVEVRLEWARGRRQTFTGRAYPQVPPRWRAHPGVRYLVRLDLPSVFRNRGYPLTYRYRGLRTAPWITVQDWRERLVALAAHEAYHTHQFRHAMRRSEVQAERWAAGVLASWRADAMARPARRLGLTDAPTDRQPDAPVQLQLLLPGVA